MTITYGITHFAVQCPWHAWLAFEHLFWSLTACMYIAWKNWMKTIILTGRFLYSWLICNNEHQLLLYSFSLHIIKTITWAAQKLNFHEPLHVLLRVAIFMRFRSILKWECRSCPATCWRHNGFVVDDSATESLSEPPRYPSSARIRYLPEAIILCDFGGLWRSTRFNRSGLRLGSGFITLKVRMLSFVTPVTKL